MGRYAGAPFTRIPFKFMHVSSDSHSQNAENKVYVIHLSKLPNSTLISKLKIIKQAVFCGGCGTSAAHSPAGHLFRARAFLAAAALYSCEHILICNA